MTRLLELLVCGLIFMFGYVSGLSTERGRWVKLFTSVLSGAGLDQAAADLRARLRVGQGRPSAGAPGDNGTGQVRQ